MLIVMLAEQFSVLEVSRNVQIDSNLVTLGLSKEWACQAQLGINVYIDLAL